MTNIAICDDERADIAYLTTLVQKWGATRGIACACHSFESAESFLFAFEDDKSIDILLLDIQMKEMDGMTLARLIRRDDETVQIVSSQATRILWPKVMMFGSTLSDEARQ